MPRIGVVGPAVSVERILYVAESMQLSLEFVPFCYAVFTEAADIVSAHQTRIDGWLFSGPSPYMAAQPVLPSDTIAVSCQHFGAGLYRAIINMSAELGHLATEVSIDIPQGEEIEDNIRTSLQELEIPTDNMKLKAYTNDFHEAELLSFHRDLFRQGLSEGVVTSLHSLYEVLKQEGIPAVHNTITKMEIKQAIHALVEKVHAAYFRNTQVGVEIIDVGVFTEKEEVLVTPYFLQETELDIKRVLIGLSRQLDGYLIEKGSGRYEIFSSRGAVERGRLFLTQALVKLEELLSAPVYGGIGFGQSVHTAEIHASKAIHFAKDKQCQVAVIQDDGMLTEFVGDDRELTYAYLSQDAVLLEKLKTAGVSVRIYQKLISVLQRTGWSAFTVTQLADQLSVTARNISRIMNGLVTAGLAECVGQELGAERGRPSKIFRLIERVL